MKWPAHASKNSPATPSSPFTFRAGAERCSRCQARRKGRSGTEARVLPSTVQLAARARVKDVNGSPLLARSALRCSDPLRSALLCSAVLRPASYRSGGVIAGIIVARACAQGVRGLGVLRGLETRVNVGDHPQPVPYLLYGWRILGEPSDKSVDDAMTTTITTTAWPPVDLWFGPTWQA